MEAGAATVRRTRRPAWVAGLAPLLVLGAAIALFTALGAPGLERRGVPVEELSVERTVLRPGEIQLSVRNTGPDPVAVRQVIVNDSFTGFRQTDTGLGRLEGGRVTVAYPWIEGEAYEIAMLTSTGATIDHTIEAAAETPEADAGFFGLMGLIGLYVGIIPVAIGMLWLPWIRRIDARWIRFALALTVGLLAFLAIDATFEGVELAGIGGEAFGGAALVFLGAAAAYLALSAVDAAMRARGRRAEDRGVTGAMGLRLAMLVALGIGLHNLGEGLAIGAAYAVGALALGATLVIGFALHNTTEGLAIVAPASGERITPARLIALGLVAGAPVIPGAWIGASAYHPAAAAVLFGVGAGAIVQVAVQIAPSLRDGTGTLFNPLAVGGLLAGLAIMYVTGLAISV
jgi:ZIP family zinc transporter